MAANTLTGSAMMECSRVLLNKGETKLAVETAIEALAKIRASSGEGVSAKLASEDRDAVCLVVEAQMAGERTSDAHRVVEGALARLKATWNGVEQATQLLIIAQARFATGRLSEASFAAREAARSFQAEGRKEFEAQALAVAASAEFSEEKGQPVEAAQAVVKLGKELGDKRLEAAALVSLANTHLGRITVENRLYKFPSREHTTKATAAAKEAYAIFKELGDTKGKEQATMALSNAMLLNGVAPQLLPNVDELIASKDIAELIRSLGGFGSTFHSAAAGAKGVAPPTKEQKEARTNMEYERSDFGWRDVTKDYHYLMVWEPQTAPNAMGRNALSARMVGDGPRTFLCPVAHQLRPQDPSTISGNQSLIVHVCTYEATMNYGTCLMNVLQTMASLLAINSGELRRLCFVQIGEAPPNFTRSGPNKNAARVLGMTPALLGMIRTARIEDPRLSVGFVAGDYASWMSNREEMINRIFDTNFEAETGNEPEVWYSRGKSFMPTLKGPTPMESNKSSVAVAPPKKTW